MLLFIVLPAGQTEIDKLSQYSSSGYSSELSTDDERCSLTLDSETESDDDKTFIDPSVKHKNTLTAALSKCANV